MATEKVKAAPRPTQHMHWLLPGYCICLAYFPARYRHFIDSGVKFCILSHLGRFITDFHHRKLKLDLASLSPALRH